MEPLDYREWREKCAAYRKQREAADVKYAGDPFLGPVPKDYEPEPEPEPRAEAPDEPLFPNEQRGIAACLIDVCVAGAVVTCPMPGCIACRERDAAWEALYRTLEPQYQDMVQRFLVFAELLPPGMPESDR